MSAEATRREEELAQGKTNESRLPRLVVGVAVVAIIVGSIWALSRPTYPAGVGDAPLQPKLIPLIRWNETLPTKARTATLIGEMAPDFEWVRPDGSMQRLSDHRGQVVVINWWAVSCPPCVAEMPALQRVARSERDVVFLAVDMQEPEENVKNFLDRLELTDLVVVIDPNGQTEKRYNSFPPPQTFFVGPDGIIRHREIGGPMSEEEIRRGIAKARGG
jgi:thiol-disulfide isomerase/thioredoxin